VIPDPAPPYELDATAAFTSKVRKMLDRSKALGVGDQVDRAIAEILSLLINSPREWGDPIRDYRHAHLTEFHGRHQKFLCVYAVHFRIPIVFATQLIAQEGNPLFGESFDV
jgi:hypothetical protein